ncbi:RBBP8 N-terminal-like protein isoform X2 [Erinaceus europaeus]|uniref:RBBP8 N-terminal-like protein isoform X2 n=1 Tax=Erinaceus europaeus TaxID=9365 RepID=A0ABM3WDS9_ERIEU|nr:RBBP8 N-terminal-like protein isoform X2 [Erinaceus europaeus]
MESFMESLNRLKDIHETEVLGLQNKLLELNAERCRDAQRVEELCGKNQQLREQQKVLKDNIRVLENRLRAGLCDRCMVTQELARKKQQEFESSLLQSLQHVFILTNEMNRLQEENEALKKEVKQLQTSGDGPKPPCKEGASDPPSPLLLPSPGTWKAITEKPPETHEEAEDDKPEKSTGYRTSPGTKISPGANLPEPRAPDMSPQRISNQLHGTIAVVRPGSWACPADRVSANGTPPLLPARSSPPSPQYEHCLSLDSFLRASRPAVVTYEALKRSVQADRLSLLNHHLSLRLRSSHSSPRAAATNMPGGPQSQSLKVGETEAWEEPASLPGTLVDIRNTQLEGALHLLLAQQLQMRGQGDSARPRGPPSQPSPPAGSDSDSPEGEAARTVLPRGQHPQARVLSSPTGKEVTATLDCVPDKPLDLSEWGRGRGAPKPASRPAPLSPPTACTPSSEPPLQAEQPVHSEPLTPNPQTLSNGSKGSKALDLEEPPTPQGSPHSLPGPQPSLASPDGLEDEDRERLRLAHNLKRPGTNGHTEHETQGHQSESEESEEPATLDSEVGPSSKAGAMQSTSGERPRCFCTTEHGQGLQQKRKRAEDPWSKASKKPPQERRNLRDSLTTTMGPGSPQEPADRNLAPGNSSWEET